jgi:hypothetical protein
MGRWAHTVAAFSVIAIACAPADATGMEAGPPRTIRVVVCDSVGVTPEVLATARLTTARVYGQIGIDIVWRDRVDQPGRPASPTSESGTMTVYLRLVPLAWEPPAVTLSGALGFTTVGGRVASVVFERIVDLASNESLSVPDLLGYVMAHELGHLLLGSKPHAVSGIMSETVDRRGVTQGLLWFTRDEANAVRAKLRSPAQ